MINKFNFLYYPSKLNLFTGILITIILLGGCNAKGQIDMMGGDDSPEIRKEEKKVREAIFGLDEYGGD